MSVLYSTITPFLLAKEGYEYISDAKIIVFYKTFFTTLHKTTHFRLIRLSAVKETKAHNCVCAAAVQSKLCHCVIRNGVTNHGAGKHEWLKGI